MGGLSIRLRSCGICRSRCRRSDFRGISPRRAVMTWKPVVSTPGTQRFHLLSTAHCRLLRFTLRNAAHDELRMAQDAEQKLQEHGQTPTPGKIVAELGFGYWVGLFANRYDERL